MAAAISVLVYLGCTSMHAPLMVTHLKDVGWPNLQTKTAMIRDTTLYFEDKTGKVVHVPYNPDDGDKVFRSMTVDRPTGLQEAN